MNTQSETNEERFVPPQKKFTAEVYVGIFAVLGIACFAYLAVGLAGMQLSKAGYYRIVAEFDNVAGLQEGASVEIAGVAVGEVEDIALDGVTAKVTLSIANSAKLRSDDIAAIRTKGIIGDRYVKIIPGGADEVLEGGDRLGDTESAVEFEEIIGKFIHKME